MATNGRDGLVPRILAALVLVYGLLAAGLFSWNIPPFQNADEISHALRADQISHGRLIGRRLGPDTSGGAVDQVLLDAFTPFAPLLFHPDTKATNAMYATAAPLHWRDGQVEVNFPNTAVYPPTFYLPAVLAIWAGKATGLSVLDTLYLARICTAVVSLLLAAWGIVAAGVAAPWIFAIICLPMSLSLMADISQDGAMIGCSALLAGLVAGARQRGVATTPGRAWACCLLATLIAVARPPYVPVALLPALLPGVRLRRRAMMAACTILATLLWALLAAAFTLTKTQTEVPVDPAAQLHWVMTHPGGMVMVALHTVQYLTGTLAEQFVGMLGWLDTPLPPDYIAVAQGVLLLTLLVTVTGRSVVPIPPVRAWVEAGCVVLGIAASTALLFAVQYLTWNAVGAALIGGVQGRYFLPLALALGAVLPGLLPGLSRSARVRNGGLAIVSAAPILGLTVAIRMVVRRYYTG